jgi:F-type H+-transporting ATPase subunit epsilon
MKGSFMHLSVFLPTTSLLQVEVNKVKGESPAGEFCLKPRHIDYVTTLTPGIFSYVTPAGQEHFLAMDQGILVKQRDKLTVATRRAVSGELGLLFREIEKMLAEGTERERQNRSSMAKLEIGFLKNMLEFSQRG